MDPPPESVVGVRRPRPACIALMGVGRATTPLTPPHPARDADSSAPAPDAPTHPPTLAGCPNKTSRASNSRVGKLDLATASVVGVAPSPPPKAKAMRATSPRIVVGRPTPAMAGDHPQRWQHRLGNVCMPPTFTYSTLIVTSRARKFRLALFGLKTFVVIAKRSALMSTLVKIGVSRLKLSALR